MKGVNLEQLNLVAKLVTKDGMEHALVSYISFKFTALDSFWVSTHSL